ncbi:hypothetical protein BGZ65_006408 [Modicella reniformis]|uniref:Crinkler effector protein N-terminal domain-containing protein n=1 Tax=Modicella reniformis TaxID=1440133 RepID=A0A9P6MG97_9FUNG|nr:hypothetical protein BGZ65_006408 [Modicella reniformis]
MTNILTLFCLVDGESASSAFNVRLPPGRYVNDLKTAIKREKSPEFDDIAADKLTLWKVLIPYNSAKKNLKFYLGQLQANEKEELDDPMTRLNKMFTEQPPDDTISIIVEHPRSGGKRKPEEHDLNDFKKRAKALATLLAGQDLNLEDLNLPNPPIRWKHNFYDRDKFFKTIIPDIIRNYDSRGQMERKSQTIFLFPGGSGIGKTRAGYELQRLVTHADQLRINLDTGTGETLDTFRTALQNPCYLYVNLYGVCEYNHDVDEHHEGSVRIGARLAVAAGLGSSHLNRMRRFPLAQETAAEMAR